MTTEPDFVRAPWIHRFKRMQRLNLWLKALACRVCRMKIFDAENKLLAIGWYDPELKVTYIVWRRKK